MAVSCAKFTDFLSRRSEHLDDTIIRSMHPIDNWIGHVSTGRFRAEDGVEHTFDRFENVYPDLRGAWEDVTAASCVGKPCDPSETKIGLGFTRDSYKLQRKSYATDLFCFDQILSADRAKQQFAHVIRTLRRASTLITSNRFRQEATRIAKYKWACANNTLVPITAVWDATMTQLTISTLPTSKISARHLQRRVNPQIRLGALGEEINRGGAPMLEYVTDNEDEWNLVEGAPELADHWRFTQWDDAQKYHKYGWTGRVGNYGLRADTYCLRFNNLGQNADGTWTLQKVEPYTNVSATEGIKEDINNDFDNSHFQIDFIWHRKAMTSLVRDTTAINPEMPFAMRDFAGRWQFAMDNLTCGTDVNGNPIAVDNSRRNKGKFLADFSFATQSEYPELAEMFIKLREPACIVDLPTCGPDPGYPAQTYDSSNSPCIDTSAPVTLTFTPVKDLLTGTYEVNRDSITCNGVTIVHDAITGTSTLATLVAQMNTIGGVSALGTWAVSGSNITLTGTACTDVGIGWRV